MGGGIQAHVNDNHGKPHGLNKYAYMLNIYAYSSVSLCVHLSLFVMGDNRILCAVPFYGESGLLL